MAESQTSPSTYAAYWLFKLDPAYLRLTDAEQAAGKQEFVRALDVRSERVQLRSAYSTVGFRHDVDFMLWMLATDLDDLQTLATSLRRTGLGKYLTVVETYIGVVTGARYDPAHQPAFMLGVAPKKFISVYPFVNTSEWYQLSYERRRALMAEHGEIGRKYAVPREKLVPAGTVAAGGTATAVATQAEPATAEVGGGVLANTVDSFGLGDYEFILANESDDASEIVRMMESLRRSEVRIYTKLDTPIYLGRAGSPEEVLATL